MYQNKVKEDFSFWTVGKYPSDVRIKMPCDLSNGASAVLTYHGYKFYVRCLLRGGFNNDIYHKSHSIWLLYDSDRISSNSYLDGRPVSNDLSRNPRRIFDGNIQMSEFLEIADMLIIEQIHGA